MTTVNVAPPDRSGGRPPVPRAGRRRRNVRFPGWGPADRWVSGWVGGLVLLTVAGQLALRRLGGQIGARLASEEPDAGSESAEKILWAAAAVVIVGGVGLVMRNTLVAAVNSIRINLGW